MESGLDTSATLKYTSSDSSVNALAAASRLLASMSVRITFAPSFAKAVLMARPTPEAAPVTTANLPVKFSMR